MDQALLNAVKMDRIGDVAGRHNTKEADSYLAQQDAATNERERSAYIASLTGGMDAHLALMDAAADELAIADYIASMDAAELEGVLQAEYRDDYETRRDLRSWAVQ